jgi:hypothetical protein
MLPAATGNFRFVVLGSGVRLAVLLRDSGAMTMTLARPLHFVMVCAAFLFVAAIVVGAL